GLRWGYFAACFIFCFFCLGVSGAGGGGASGAGASMRARTSVVVTFGPFETRFTAQGTPSARQVSIVKASPPSTVDVEVDLRQEKCPAGTSISSTGLPA